MLVPNIEELKLSKVGDSEEGYTVEVESILDQGDRYNSDILTDPKAKMKFIKQVERYVRRSFEYRTYIGFLKNELDLTKCVLLPMIDIKELKNVGLELHHYPFTLFDIVSIILDDWIFEKNMTKISPFKLAEEVMRLHFQNHVGLVPLSKTVHELAHSGKLFINLKYVTGNYNKFISNYSAVGDYLQKLENLESQSEKEDVEGSLNGDILDKKLLTVNINDIEQPEKLVIEEDQLA
jgi:hypothetical protein